MKKITLFVLILLFCSSRLFSQNDDGIKFLENSSWENVLSKAKGGNKLIFMDCYTSWCGPCKALAKDVFTQKVCGDFFNGQFVCVKYDMEKGEGVELYNRYKQNIPGFPTMLVIDPDNGNVITSIVGFKKPEKLIEMVKNGLSGKSIDKLEAQYNSGDRSYALIKDYSDMLADMYNNKKRESVIRDYVESLPVDSLMSKRIFNLYYNFLTDTDSPRYKFVLDNMNKIILLFKFDRSMLENRLERTAMDKVKSILNPANNDGMSSASLLKQSDNMKTMLKGANVKGFPSLYAKLAINDYKLNNDIAGLDRILDASDILNATNNDYYYKADMATYIIDNSNDKKMISKYCLFLQDVQGHSKNSGIFTMNYYDVIARALYKLGKKSEAVEAEQKFEDIYSKKIQEAKNLFGDGHNSDMDNEYRNVVNDQRKFLKMQPIK